ncbi:DNA-binding protein P3A2-like isoform X3 [Neocloeon triangulifer]|uniref:DNA-binding protein P3A2-like isoform X3 n=1 Tax=Neocloeon triangulifer TaxID=2078957 RepID=UPI00286F3044|nr:DNA-binding protein P3A2-like isoform X3 [Neocloeon triangulifer]
MSAAGAETQPSPSMVTMSGATSGESQIVLPGSPPGNDSGTDANLTHMVSDNEDNMPSSPDSTCFDDDDDDDDDNDGADLMTVAMSDDVTAQLAAAGPVGVAAAAAIASSKKRKRPHSFETNPSIRKRQQNRLLRKLRQTIDEFATRVGQQAVVLVGTPGKPNNSFKVFGAKPLEDVVRNLRSVIMQELETALAQQAPPPVQEDPSLYELPPLVIDGIPTPVEKMTQAQLRAFIPLMLKYSTGRGKPGWGRESTRPPWWPKDLPWANVRMDARSEEEKQKISWTHALRQIVINCYKFHGRDDLLPAFNEDEEQKPNIAGLNSTIKVHKITSPNLTAAAQQQTQVTQQYAPAVLQTISNPDGTVSIIQVDPNNPIITLPDGTTAQVQGVATGELPAVFQIHTGTGQDGSTTVHAVQALSDVTHGEGGSVSVDLNTVTEATLGQDGQLILTGEDGHGYPVSVSGMITVPVGANMYQTVVANIQQLQNQADGTTVQVVTPVVQVPKVEGGSDGIETITVGPGGMVVGQEGQVLQVVSLKDAQSLKAVSPPTIKEEAEVTVVVSTANSSEN